MRAAFLLFALAACAEGETDPDADLPEPAPLTTVSNACPDLSETGIKTFMSAGKERRAAIYFPSDPQPGMPVMFAWHGLSAAEFQPMESMVFGFDLEDFAEEEGAVVIVPEAQSINLVGFDVLLWGILGNEFEDEDLTLFDDLRTCVSDAFDVDLRRVMSWGHSGGGLWTSLLLMERADVLSTGVSSSGGTDLLIPVLGDRLPYRAPSQKVSAMLISGGDEDVWPDPTFPIIEFENTTDAFQDRLVADGNYVVRCKHDQGHSYLPSWFWNQTTKWLMNHTYGAPSPWESGERNTHDACEAI
jgi:poly(3-hydroxybutyrate) depolymerase